MNELKMTCPRCPNNEMTLEKSVFSTVDGLWVETWKCGACFMRVYETLYTPISTPAIGEPLLPPTTKDVAGGGSGALVQLSGAASTIPLAFPARNPTLSLKACISLHICAHCCEAPIADGHYLCANCRRSFDYHTGTVQ